MIPQHAKLPQLYLRPGEFYYTADPMVITTVLGSCVAITMFSKHYRIAAICHALLPECRNKKNCNSGCVEGFKYLDCTFHEMLRQFDQFKIRRRDIDLKLFGGADMFELKARKRHVKTVGQQNVELALDLISKERLHLKASDVGGLNGRKLFFFTETGEIFLKKLVKAEFNRSVRS